MIEATSHKLLQGGITLRLSTVKKKESVLILFSLGREHQKKSTKSIYSCKRERNRSLFVCKHKSNLTQVTSTLKLYKMAMEREISSLISQFWVANSHYRDSIKPYFLSILNTPNIIKILKSGFSKNWSILIGPGCSKRPPTQYYSQPYQ